MIGSRNLVGKGKKKKKKETGQKTMTIMWTTTKKITQKYSTVKFAFGLKYSG